MSKTKKLVLAATLAVATLGMGGAFAEPLLPGRPPQIRSSYTVGGVTLVVPEGVRGPANATIVYAWDRIVLNHNQTLL